MGGGGWEEAVDEGGTQNKNGFCVFLPLWDANFSASYNGADTAQPIDCLAAPPPPPPTPLPTLTFAYPRPHLLLLTFTLSGHLPKLFCHLSPLK